MGDYMKEFFSNLKFAWQFTRDQKKKFILNIFYGICLIFISVCVPILSAKVIVTLTKSEFKQLLMISIVILVVEWSRNIFNYLGTRSAQIIYREGVIKVQTRLGREILKLEKNYHWILPDFYKEILNFSNGLELDNEETFIFLFSTIYIL